MEDTDLLFVYGTLRRDSQSDMSRLLARHATCLGDATYGGILYLVDGYPGVVPGREPGDIVRGELYKMHEPEQLLLELDNYEECGADFKQPTEYIREVATVMTTDGCEVNAWIYLYNHPTGSLRRIESGDFFAS